MRKALLLSATVVVAMAFTSCSESNASAEEKTEMNKMDSISRAVKDSTDRLKDQTKKVEDALEKLDKEFPTDNQKK